MANKVELARMRARTSSFPDVSGSQYQVLEQDEHGATSRKTGDVIAPSEGGGASRLGAWTAAFAGMTIAFAWLAHAPAWLLGSLAGVMVLGVIVAVWPRHSRESGRARN